MGINVTHMKSLSHFHSKRSLQCVFLASFQEVFVTLMVPHKPYQTCQQTKETAIHAEAATKYMNKNTYNKLDKGLQQESEATRPDYNINRLLHECMLSTNSNNKKLKQHATAGLCGVMS